ncbi:integrase, catalytic region, zinc finger, CCHC-type containing protein [Tanacetum coccineum]
MFHLKKAQRIKPTLYDGIVMSDKHVVMPVIDDEETLILEEESRSKMSEKAKDPKVINKNISHKPIDYEKLNRLTDDFGKRFTPQQELLAEQAFWLRMFDPTSKPSDAFITTPQRIKPTLYDGIIMSDKHVAMPVIDDEETLILEEDSRSKMSKKAKDSEVINKNISHKPIDYEKVNRLTEYFGKHFTPQQELSAEQDFWLHMFDPTNKPSDALPVKIKAPKELPKISLVNESLKKLKFHLAKFDNVVKIRTTPNARTEGEWGFEHTKAVFNNEIIPFLKSLKDIFNVFDRDLLNEIMEVKTVFDQMDAAVQQSSVDKQCLEIAKKELLLENDRLLQQIMSQDVLLTVMNSMSLIGESVNMDGKRKESCNLEAELLKSQNAFKDLLKSHSQLEKHYNEDLKAQIQDKVFVITSLKNDLRKLKGKEIVDIAAQIPSATTIVPGMFKLDLESLAPRFLQNREAHLEYLNAKKVVVTPKNTIKKVRFAEPLTSSSNVKHVESSKTSDSNIHVLSSTGLKCSTSKCGSKPTGNKRNDRISHTPSRNMKNKVEAQPRKKSLFGGVHDMCFLDFVKNVNIRAKYAKKHNKENIWKPTGHVLTEVGLKWKPTGRTFTIVGNSCPLTRITSANVVPPKKTTSDSVETQKPELKVYSRKPKNVKNVGSSKTSKIVESKNANCSEPNHTWGSNATDIPSSSSLVMTGYPDCSLVSGLRTVRFGNDHIERIMGYNDYKLGNVTISRVYYVEGLGHNLFFVGQFCDGDLEVAFQKNTCFIHNLEGVDLLFGSYDTNLYTIRSVFYLKHQRLKAGYGTVCYHISTSEKASNPSINPKLKTLTKRSYIFYIWICVARCVFLRIKDEAPETIIKCIKNIQLRLNATVHNVRTDNGTEFINQTLREFYENVGISHQTSVAGTPQQNGVVKRQNRTLVEAAHTMLILSKAPLFL